jgi:hypothetical protein
VSTQHDYRGFSRASTDQLPRLNLNNMPYVLTRDDAGIAAYGFFA